MKMNNEQKETMKKHLYTNTIDKKKNITGNPFDYTPMDKKAEKKLFLYADEIEIFQEIQNKYDIEK